MADKLTVSLDDLLSDTAGYVSIKGVQHAVKPITAPALQFLERLEDPDPKAQPTTEEAIAHMRELCPSLSEEFWKTAPTTVIGIIFAVSRSRVRQVQDALPLSSGPATPTPPAETSASPEG